MKDPYIDALNKIKASDATKSEIIARMQEKAADKRTRVPGRKKWIMTSSAAFCVLFLCVSIPLILHYSSHDGGGTLTPQNTGVFRIGQKYTRDDGGTVIFTNIRLEKNPTITGTAYNGIYLIISGTFAFEQYALYTDESAAMLFNKDIGENVVLHFDRSLTEKLSAADLHIDDNKGETRGEVSLVYRIGKATLDFILAHANDPYDPDSVFGDITLTLSDCYMKDGISAQFIFFCKDIVLP